MFCKKFLNSITIAAIVLFSCNALSDKKNKSTSKKVTETSMVVDVETGKVLHSVNGHERIYPASLTKLMTLYLCFDEAKSGRVKLEEKLQVSKKAEMAKPSKLGLRAGETISFRDAILSLIVKSANDSAIVVAEKISGSEEEFAKKMTKKAKELGMHNTEFYNSSGLHHPNQKTTAYDLARLGLILRKKYPEFYPLFKKTSFEFAGRIVTGHNKVTQNYKGAEGMKTGFTCPSGFNLVTTANKEGKTLLGIVTGSPTAKYRDQKMVKLLDKHFGFDNSNTKQLASDEKKTAKISKTIGKAVSKKDLKKTLAVAEKKKSKKNFAKKKISTKKYKQHKTRSKAKITLT